MPRCQICYGPVSLCNSGLVASHRHRGGKCDGVGQRPVPHEFGAYISGIVAFYEVTRFHPMTAEIRVNIIRFVSYLVQYGSVRMNGVDYRYVSGEILRRVVATKRAMKDDEVHTGKLVYKTPNRVYRKQPR